MLVVLILTTLCVCLAAWVHSWRQARTYWARRGVPFIPPNPFVGNLTFLLRKNPSLWMREVYRQYRTPYVGIWLFRRPALVVNSPELARNILVRDSGNFRNKFATAGDWDRIGSLNMLLVKDPLWTDIRRHFSAAFSPAKLKSVQAVAVSKAQDLVTRIDRNRHTDISLRPMFSDYTTDVFSEAALELASDTTRSGGGVVRGNTTRSGDGVVRAITREIMRFSVSRGLSWCAIFFWPEFANFFRLQFAPQKAIENLRGVLTALYQRKEAEQVKEPKTILDFLVQMKKSEETKGNAGYAADLVLAQAAALLVGGFDTSSATLTYLVYQLAHAPLVQDKLYQELVETKNKHGYQLDAIANECTYIDCVIKETLRVFPPMAWLDRVALAEYRVDEQLTISAGTPVYVNGVGMQVDEQFYPQPYTFDPERFSADNESSIPPYTYMPFGEGPRTCIGKRYAMVAMRQAVAALFLRYRAAPPAPPARAPAPLAAAVQSTGLFLMPGEDLRVNFTPR